MKQLIWQLLDHGSVFQPGKKKRKKKKKSKLFCEIRASKCCTSLFSEMKVTYYFANVI